MKKMEQKETSGLILHMNENLNREEQIAQRAHELWQQRNGEHGNDLTDWFQAEREINEWNHRQLKSNA